jgi:hypothetical protein
MNCEIEGWNLEERPTHTKHFVLFLSLCEIGALFLYTANQSVVVGICLLRCALQTGHHNTQSSRGEVK